jgi:hypothetical protein
MSFQKTRAFALFGFCLILIIVGLFEGYMAPSNTLADDSGGLPIPPYQAPSQGNDSTSIDSLSTQGSPATPSEPSLFEVVVELVENIF